MKIRLALGTIAVVVLFLVVCKNLSFVNEYELNGKVTNISNDEICVELENGQIVAYLGDGVKMGDSVQLVLNTNGTDDYLEDDLVVFAELVK